MLSIYVLGFALGQLLIGSVSDRFGRRSVLLVGHRRLRARRDPVQRRAELRPPARRPHAAGAASAAPRVVTISIVRDCYGGRRMASVMSLAMVVFMAVPILAPSLGQLVVLVAPWRAIFVFLTLYALAAALWVSLRLPETLAPSARRSLAPADVLRLAVEIVGNRQSVGYALAGGLIFGAMFGFLLSAQQVFTDFSGSAPISARLRVGGAGDVDLVLPQFAPRRSLRDAAALPRCGGGRTSCSRAIAATLRASTS